MPRMVLFAGGIAWILGSLVPVRADEAEDKAAQFFESRPPRLASGSPLIRDKQPGKPVVGLACGFGGRRVEVRELWSKIADLSNLRDLVLVKARGDTASGEITETEIKQLARLKQLTTLTICGSKLTDNGWKELAKLKSLKTLGLLGTPVSANGLKELATLDNLATLQLGGVQLTQVTPLEKEVVVAINTHVDSVQFEYFMREDEKRDPIAAQMRLLELNLMSEKDKQKEGMKIVDALSSEFENGSAIDPADLGQLAPLKNLTTLALPGKLTDETLSQLRGVNLLHALPIATAAAGKRPTKPEDVIAFNLYATAVTDLGLWELAAFKNLTTLTLPGKVTDRNLLELQKANLLHALDLATANGKRPTKADDVTTLDLSNTTVTGAGLAAIKDLKKLTTLTLPGKATDKMLAELQKVNLLHATTLATANGKRPTKPEDVTTLELGKTDVTVAVLKDLKDFKNLTTLTLPGKLNDATFAGLRASNLLHALELATAPGGKRPAKPEDVTTLDLSKTDVTAAVVKELKDLKSLTTLTLPGKASDETLASLREADLLHTLPRATAKGGKRATNAEGVHSLYLSSSKVTDAGLKELADLKNLSTLSLLETNVTDAGLKELAALKGLTDLNLFRTKVTDAGVRELQKALPKCTISR